MHQQNLKVSLGERFIGASLIIIIDYHSVFSYTFAGQCRKCLKLARVSYVILHTAKWISINIGKIPTLVFGNHIKNSKVTF